MNNSAGSAGNQSFGSRVTQTYQGMSGTYKVIFFIFLAIVIGLLIYWGVSSTRGSTYNSRLNPIIVSEPINAFDNGLENRPLTLPVTNGGLAFTYSFWIYVQDWSYNYGVRKYIIIKGRPDAGDSQWSPAIWLGDKMNTLHSSIALFPGDNKSGGDPFETCIIKDIPLQKWVYVAYILNNRNVDIYIDGKLEKSCLLDGVPNLNNAPLYVTPNPTMPGHPDVKNGFYGQISSFQYFSRALLPSEVSSIYTQGPYSLY